METSNQVENKERVRTRFESPVPFVIALRNLVYGKKKPDMYTRIAFVINMIIWVTFFLWNIISYFVITNRDVLRIQKGINVERIIETRGSELGFEVGQFMNRLLTFHAISIICWGLIFIGLVLLYRKKKQFIYFTLAPLTFYIGMMLFYIGFTYFAQDTTMFDKIALLVFVVSILMHAYLLQNERSGGSISFFGETEDDKEDE